jgi:hypothetical protein
LQRKICDLIIAESFPRIYSWLKEDVLCNGCFIDFYSVCLENHDNY